jgi:hypothetical protein
MRKNSVEAGCSFTVFAVLDSAKKAKSGYLSEQVQHVVSMKDPHVV